MEMELYCFYSLCCIVPLPILTRHPSYQATSAKPFSQFIHVCFEALTAFQEYPLRSCYALNNSFERENVRKREKHQNRLRTSITFFGRPLTSRDFSVITEVTEFLMNLEYARRFMEPYEKVFSHRTYLTDRMQFCNTHIASLFHRELFIYSSYAHQPATRDPCERRQRRETLLKREFVKGPQQIHPRD